MTGKNFLNQAFCRVKGQLSTGFPQLVDKSDKYQRILFCFILKRFCYNFEKRVVPYWPALAWPINDKEA